MTYYRLIVLGATGMYTYGDLAGSPELAKLAVGNLQRRDRRLGVVALKEAGGTWSDCAHVRYENPVLIEAEEAAGDWAVGAAESHARRV